MPKRAINYPYNATQAYLKDRYANIRAEFALKNGVNELETTSRDFYYETKDGLKFFVYRGEGELEFGDALREYDFFCANAQKIDKAMFENTPEHKLDKETRDFLEVYEKNLEKGKSYLLPPFFSQKEREILEIKECKC